MNVKKFTGKFFAVCCAAALASAVFSACEDKKSEPEQPADDPSAATQMGDLDMKPATEAEKIFDLLPYCDMVLVMSVEPGFGGQKFMPQAVGKIAALAAEIKRRGLNVEIEVDGGINGQTSAIVREAGANVLVSGSFLFHAEDMAAAANALKDDRIC